MLKEGLSVVLERGRSLADIAYEEMIGLIRSGAWPPGARLPSEAELCRRFGMSRPILRQALARLRREGLIQSRQGSGSFVIGTADREEPDRAAAPQPSFPAIASLGDLSSFMVFREGVEAEAAAMAALRRTDAQIADLRAAAARLRVGASRKDLSEHDYAFHLAIARASGNPFSANTISSLRDHLMLGLGLIWNFAGGRRDFHEQVLSQHEAIIGAIERGDADAARQAMRDHLQWSRLWLLDGSSSR